MHSTMSRSGRGFAAAVPCQVPTASTPCSHPPIVVLAGLATLIASASLTSAQQPTFRRIAIHGDQAPGRPAGVTFFNTLMEVNFPSWPLIDDDGNVSFHAMLIGPGVTPSIAGNAAAVYRHTRNPSETLSLIARQQQSAPGFSAGVVFEGFPSVLGPRAPSIDGGFVTFAARVAGPGVSSEDAAGIWSDHSGSLQLRYRTGDAFDVATPGAVLRDISIFPTRADRDTGRLTFQGFWRIPGSSGQNLADMEGIFTERSGVLEAIVRGGDPAPGVPGAVFGEGAFFATSGAIRSWAADTAHRVVFHGNLRGPGIDDLNDEGIWIEGTGGLELLIREGDPAPGLGAGARIGIASGVNAFASRFPIIVNDAGDLVFMARADLAGPVNFVEALYVLRGQSLELVALARDATAPEPGPQAPGLAPGMYFRAILGASVSNAGRVALAASTTDHGGAVSGGGVWMEDQHGSLMLVAATGMQVEGLLPGVVYLESFAIGFTQGERTIFFIARIAGPGVVTGNALFLTDPSGVAHPVLVRGQQLDTAPAGAPPQLRTVADFLTGSINGSGEIPFKVLFTDSTIGVMTVSLVPPCYANCDGSTVDPVLNVDDFTCFINEFAAAQSLPHAQQVEHYANCDGSTTAPVLNVDDFTCFINAFAAGCP